MAILTELPDDVSEVDTIKSYLDKYLYKKGVERYRPNAAK